MYINATILIRDMLMAKNEKCRISNCKNIITYKGTICGTHKWRMNKYNSYDLPSYQGEPNTYVENKLPEGIVKNCEIHGNLNSTEVYNRYYKGHISSQYCKKCMLSLNIKNKYKGMNNLEDYDDMLAKQNNCCAICKDQNTTTRNGKIKRFAIDHCHGTEKVRGLLCSFCNAILGYAKDDISILESAIKYLKSHS